MMRRRIGFLVGMTVVLGACGSDGAEVARENMARIEAEINAVAKTMNVPANLLPVDDLEFVAQRAAVEGWGTVRAEKGRVQLNYDGVYLCLVLPDEQGNGRELLDGPCS